MFDADDGKKAGQAVEDTLNDAAGRKKRQDLVRHLTMMHPTLQQIFIREVVLPFLRYMAEEDRKGFTDARNQGTGKAASVMTEAFDKTPGITLPLV